MFWKQLAINFFNARLRCLDLQIVPTWRLQWWRAAVEFDFWGIHYQCFCHSYNCGWPPYASERCVELALADLWLNAIQEEVLEIGAVSPYYWPDRIKRVIDPFDPHKKVTDRQSLFDVDFRGARILSISTFEHIGTGDYGSTEASFLAPAAFRKIFNESPQFLVTIPVGYNPIVDQFLLEAHEVPRDVSIGVLVRDGISGWRQEQDLRKARRPYGDPAISTQFPGTSIGHWANAVLVLERGGILNTTRETLAADNPSTNGKSVCAAPIESLSIGE